MTTTWNLIGATNKYLAKNIRLLTEVEKIKQILVDANWALCLLTITETRAHVTSDKQSGTEDDKQYQSTESTLHESQIFRGYSLAKFVH